ncbi:Bul1 [Macrophomina phaseolina MS6]|uniref:Bul1 n=1 Tax=Macrophomina phaseolina (strain MS6) TaxID=1126212 RepID=K2S7Q9_MACPH|nr:Bul1 [Macrophomina phaseolina MS6]
MTQSAGKCTVKTYVDRLTSAPQAAGSPDIRCTFLNIRHDLLEGTYRLKPDNGNRFQFSFFLPESLPRRYCDHACEEAVLEAHTRLPPSVGDDSGPEADTFYPSNVSISYAIHARVELDDASPCLETSRAICMRPAYSRSLCLLPPAIRNESEFRDETTIRSSFGTRKKGTVIMEMPQPCVLGLPGPALVVVNLRYNPEGEDCQPPRLKDIRTKLIGTTFYATTPRNTFPAKEHLHEDLSAALYSRSIALSPWTIASGKWQKYPQPAGGYVYAMQLAVPVSLPERASVIPTFHTCFVSRTYRLQLSIAVTATNFVSLKIPIQINNEDPTLPSYS